MIRAGLTRWLQEPRLTGRLAFLCGIVALALPTLVRAAVSGSVVGCEFTPYLPFVLICAILMRWWQAALVALASVAILGGLLGGSPMQHIVAPCFLSAVELFLASSAIMIGTVIVVRHAIASVLSRGSHEGSGGGIIFSLEEGRVWASWHGNGPPVPLGSQERVSEMMEDFLAQVEVAKRLNRQTR